jgi:hypothetical protein
LTLYVDGEEILPQWMLITSLLLMVGVHDMGVEFSEVNRRSFRVAIDTVVLTSICGLAFWAGSLTQRVDYIQANALLRSGKGEISSEAQERIAKVETRQTDVLAHLEELDRRLDRIESRQEVILEKLKR